MSSFEKNVKKSLTVLEEFNKKYKGNIGLSTSLSIEDQVVTDLLIKINPKAKIFTLDTGRLPEETYKLIDRTNYKYDIKISPYFPNATEVEELIINHGANPFYESIELRKTCCSIRKIEPLKRALNGLDVWITGLRREQSVTRSGLSFVEYDENFNIIKINPLIEWTEDQVWKYINENNIPYSELYKKNYLSIGCAPCTRAVAPGGDVRSGRWWWENPETKECGLHLK